MVEAYTPYKQERICCMPHDHSSVFIYIYIYTYIYIYIYIYLLLGDWGGLASESPFVMGVGGYGKFL